MPTGGLGRNGRGPGEESGQSRAIEGSGKEGDKGRREDRGKKRGPSCVSPAISACLKLLAVAMARSITASVTDNGVKLRRAQVTAMLVTSTGCPPPRSLVAASSSAAQGGTRGGLESLRVFLRGAARSCLLTLEQKLSFREIAEDTKGPQEVDEALGGEVVEMRACSLRNSLQQA